MIYRQRFIFHDNGERWHTQNSEAKDKFSHAWISTNRRRNAFETVLMHTNTVPCTHRQRHRAVSRNGKLIEDKVELDSVDAKVET